MIHLDAAATLPPLPEALEACREALARWEDADAVLDRARGQVAALVGASPEEVVFTSGGTEADNLALKGLCAAAPLERRHLIISALEPYAVDHPARTLERQGWRLSRVGVDARGRVSPAALAAALDDDTALVSVSLAHPGVGTWQHLGPLAALAHARGALFHADACAAAFAPVSLEGVDALSLSGHRLGGIAGAGALVLKAGTPIHPLIEGGIQEGGLRAGTPPLGPVAAMGAAAEAARRRDRGPLERLGALLTQGLSRLPGVRLTGDPERRIPGHASCCLAGLDGEALVTALEAGGVRAATGSPCASGTFKPDPALLALGIPEGLARGSLRLSAGPGLDEAEALRALGILEREVRRLRALAPRPAEALA